MSVSLLFQEPCEKTAAVQCHEDCAEELCSLPQTQKLGLVETVYEGSQASIDIIRATTFVADVDTSCFRVVVS